MDFQNLIIYADMDGTVLTDWDQGPVVPRRNLAAIKRFMEEGGTFSIASGRQHLDILPFFGDLIPNAPLVQGNGTSLYDCAQGRILYKLNLSGEYKAECIRFCQENPWVWVVAGSADTVMQVDFGDSRDASDKSITGNHISIRNFLEQEYTKVVYVVQSPEEIEPLRRAVSGFTSGSGIQQTLSSPVFLECYDVRAGKAAGVRKAMELAGMADKTLVCIGDYYNDETMLRDADIAACPRNAPDDLKAICRIVTCSNNDGAIADLIERLERL